MSHPSTEGSPSTGRGFFLYTPLQGKGTWASTKHLLALEELPGPAAEGRSGCAARPPQQQANESSRGNCEAGSQLDAQVVVGCIVLNAVRRLSGVACDLLADLVHTLRHRRHLRLARAALQSHHAM